MSHLFKIKIKKARKDRLLKITSALLVSALLFQELAIANPDLLKITAQSVAGAESSKVWARKILPAIPESVATIEDAYKAPNSNKTLILIQDAHTNNSGQLNVAKTLNLIFQKEPIKYVFLEAGSGYESLSFLRPYASLHIRKQAAQSFLMQGRLQGAEFFWAGKSMEQSLEKPDEADENTLNRIIWHSVKGAGSPYPAHLAGAHGTGLKKLKLILAGDDE